MNVYDFDGTIYAGDSSVDFYVYCIWHDPKLLRFFPKQLLGAILHVLKKINTTQMKECFFSFLAGVNDVDKVVLLFWDNKGRKKIKPWYEQNKKMSDLVISASPDFLITPICQRLGVQVPLCTVIDRHSGKIMGVNCKGKEKLSRFLSVYPEGSIDCFFSDSDDDQPLAEISHHAFWVKRKHIVPWENRKGEREQVWRKAKRK